MPDNYPEWTKAQLVLLKLWNVHQEAHAQGDSELLLVVSRGHEPGLHVYSPRTVDLAGEIPEIRSGAEAVSLFDRLWREEYIHVSFGPQNPGFQHTTPVFYGLSTKGLLDIGKYPDQDRRLVAAFETVRRRIEQDTPTTDPRRQSWLPMLSQIIAMLNDSRELGQEVVDAWSQVGGGPLG